MAFLIIIDIWQWIHRISLCMYQVWYILWLLLGFVHFDRAFCAINLIICKNTIIEHIIRHNFFAFIDLSSVPLLYLYVWMAFLFSWFWFRSYSLLFILLWFIPQSLFIFQIIICVFVFKWLNNFTVVFMFALFKCYTAWI